jgi:hypothetical protein
MDNNIPKITESNLPNQGYFIVKMCIHCEDITQDTATPFPMPFPSLRLAKANLMGMIDDAIDDAEQNVSFKDGIVTIKDNDGEVHQYVQAIIQINNKIVWRPGDDEQVESMFNDIINGIDFNNPTE